MKMLANTQFKHLVLVATHGYRPM